MDKRIWFIILVFFISKWVALFQMLIFFCWTMTYFVPTGVSKDKTTKMYPKYINGKLWPYHLSCPWLFEKFICELEASYSFKITCIQVISLKKIGGVISKIYCLVSWSPICTPLILLSALMKMASTSTTVIYNSMRVETPAKLLIYG